MSTPLSILNLTVRAQYCLQRGRVYDVETLKTLGPRDILAIPEIGKKIAQEINLALAEYESTNKPKEIEMNDIKDGGPAFPIKGPVSTVDKQGMTLRDYFAAKAMQGLIAQSMGTALGSNPKLAAEHAYATADAMLKAREK